MMMMMCTVLLPPGVNPIAVNKYIISYNRFYEGDKCFSVKILNFTITLGISVNRNLETQVVFVFEITRMCKDIVTPALTYVP